MKTTNIYNIVDGLVKIYGETANRIKQNITKVARALQFCPTRRSCILSRTTTKPSSFIHSTHTCPTATPILTKD